MSKELRPPAAPSLPPIEGADLQSAALAEMGLMTGALLHELRQPLFSLRGLAQIARLDAVGRQAEQLDQMLSQLDHMEELVSSYGGLLRTHDADSALDVNVQVRAALRMCESRCRSAGVKIHKDLSPEALVVLGRETALRQVVMNLVLNAVDALDGTTMPQVSVRTRDLGKRVRLEVEDTGPGVSAEIRQRLFEPFVTTKGPGRGTGLGLFLAKKLVEQSGGSLELETPPFVGARFAVELPKA